MRAAGADAHEELIEPAVAAGALAVEDIDRGIADQRVLFHLLNLARETRLSLLLTSRAAAGELDVALPDLRSRLRALAMVRIEAPDEALLQAMLIKLIADRQLVVAPRVVAHLARHMDRSQQAAVDVVATLDRIALQRRKAITLATAREAIKALWPDRGS